MAVTGSRTLNAKRNIVWAFLARAMNIILPFITRTLFIYTLGLAYLGLNSLFSYILLVLNLAELGVASAIVYSMYKPFAEGDIEQVNKLLTLYKKAYRLIGIVILAIGLILLPFLPVLIKGDVPPDINLYVLYLINLASTVLSYFLFAYKNSLFNVSQRYDVATKMTLLFTIIKTIMQIGVLIIWQDYYLYCLIVPITVASENLFRNAISIKLFPEYHCEGNITKEEQREILKNISGLFLYKVSGVVVTSIGSIAISMTIGLEAIGGFSNYLYVATSVLALIDTITTPIVHSIGNSIATETKEKNYADFRLLNAVILVLLGGASACVLALVEPFITIWVGYDYLLEPIIPVLLALYMYALRSVGGVGTYRTATGIWAQDRMRPITDVVVIIVLTFVLTPLIGVSGVLIAAIITQFFIDGIWGNKALFDYYFTEKNRWKYILESVTYLFMAIVAGVIAYFVAGLFTITDAHTIENFAWFLLEVISVVASVAIVYIVLWGRSPYFKKMIQFLKRFIAVKA